MPYSPPICRGTGNQARILGVPASGKSAISKANALHTCLTAHLANPALPLP